jgi:hypothetical protein
MPESKLTQEEVRGLAAKLSSMEGQFTESERAMLLGVLGMASAGFAAAVSRTQQDHPETRVAQRLTTPREFTTKTEVSPEELPSLGLAFQSVFTPGPAAGFSLGGISPEGEIGVSVGAPCVSVSWGKSVKSFGPATARPIEIAPIVE